MTKFLFALLLTFSFFASANSKVGNGGGGVLSDGNALTLPESGLQVEGQMMLDVPGVTQVSQALQALHVSSLILKDYLPMLYSSTQRHYYRINDISPEAMTELKKIYSDLLKIPPEKVVIFAVTDVAAAKTFLLPDFFNLKPDQQASVIFHEWLWTIDPQATYGDIIYGEQLFYRFRQDSSQYFSLAVYLAQMLQRPELLLAPAFYFAGPDVLAGEVFSDDVIDCMKPHMGKGMVEDDSAIDQCLYDWAIGLSVYESANDIQKAIARYVTLGGVLFWQGNLQFFSEAWQNDKIEYDDVSKEMYLRNRSGWRGDGLRFLKKRPR